MGLIREPLDVDFTVEPHVLTNAEKNAISEYIRDYKTKEAGKTSTPPGSKKVLKSKKEPVKF